MQLRLHTLFFCLVFLFCFFVFKCEPREELFALLVTVLNHHNLFMATEKESILIYHGLHYVLQMTFFLFCFFVFKREPREELVALLVTVLNHHNLFLATEKESILIYHGLNYVLQMRSHGLEFSEVTKFIL